MYNFINKPRVVVSYTTLPSRYEVLRKSILSLKAQTYNLDAIYLTIPKISSRLQKPYPPLPNDILSLCTVVYTDIDYGPLTKIYGALISENDPDTVIISCDDDVSFPANHIEILMKHHKTHPNTAICGTGALIGKGLFFISIVSTVVPFHTWKGTTGFTVGTKGRNVDLLFGVAGVLYTRGMFPHNNLLHDELLQYSLLDNSISCNDDVLISGYLSKMKIDRRVFLDIPIIIHLNGEDALSGDIFKMIRRLNQSIGKVKEYGFFNNMEPISIEETPAGRIFIGIFLFIIIIILCIYLYRIF